MTTVPYTDHDVTVDGLKLHYQEWGDASAPPIIMLHGFGVSGHMFDEFADRMSQRYRLIALDQRGHGDSDWSTDGDYSRDAFVDDLEHFRGKLGIDRFILVGHSMGGLNSVSYTAKHPDRVQALVLVDVGPEAAKEGVDNIMRFTRGPDELDFEEFVQMAHQFNKRRSIENIRERMRHRLRQLPSGKWTWKFDSRFRQQDSGLRIGSELSSDEVWQLFRDVRPPTLLVRGGESDVLKADTAERCVREMHRARLVTVPGAGHSVPGDSPDAFSEAVREFLDDVFAGKFEPLVEAVPPPLAELVTEQDRAARRRPGAFTLVLIGAGAAAAIAGIAIATSRSKSGDGSEPAEGESPKKDRKDARKRGRDRKRSAPRTVAVHRPSAVEARAIIDELDDVAARAMHRAREAVADADLAATTARVKSRVAPRKKRPLVLRTAVFGWRALSFAPRKLLGAGRR